MRVSELIEALKSYPGDMPVIAVPKGEYRDDDIIRVTGFRTHRPDGDAAFAIVLAMTVPGPVELVELAVIPATK